MRYPEEMPIWVGNAVASVRARSDGDRLSPIAESIAGESSLSPLWRTMEKKFNDDEFWGSAEAVFRHLVVAVDIALRDLVGYHAMSPAQLDSWRKRTQEHAISLLGDLMEGYPEIEERQDESFLGDAWVYGAAMQIATKGEFDRLGDMLDAVDKGKFDTSKFGAAFAVTSRLPLILNQLIRWLDYEAAKGHAVTHAASKNAHRNAFIRRITGFFELHLNTPMRSHVYNIAALFFDMGGLAVGDIKKVAPANQGGRIPKRFLQTDPGDETL